MSTLYIQYALNYGGMNTLSLTGPLWVKTELSFVQYIIVMIF